MKYQLRGHNNELLEALLAEQSGFCAYTEKRVLPLDTCAVEHFDSRLKGTDNDGYLNYYGVLQSANQRKRKKQARFEAKEAKFFTTRFHQEPDLGGRIQYIRGEFTYEQVAAGDEEAADLIEFLGFNDQPVVSERRRHVNMLGDLFDEAGYDGPARAKWLRVDGYQKTRRLGELV